jgi:hypothetical protein
VSALGWEPPVEANEGASANRWRTGRCEVGAGTLGRTNGYQRSMWRHCILRLDEVGPQDVEEPKLAALATARPGRPTAGCLLWRTLSDGLLDDLGGREGLQNHLHLAVCSPNHLNCGSFSAQNGYGGLARDISLATGRDSGFAVRTTRRA